MQEGIMMMQEFFVKHFMELFCKLGDDPVENVRITLAKVLLYHLKNGSKEIFQVKEI